MVSSPIPGVREGTCEQCRITKLFHSDVLPRYHPTRHQTSHSHLKCQTRRPVTRETSRKTLMMMATTTRRFGPRFSIFLEFMAGRNSTPSSRLFMSWGGREGRRVERLFPNLVWRGPATKQFRAELPISPNSRRQHLRTHPTAGQTLKAFTLLFCTRLFRPNIW